MELLLFEINEIIIDLSFIREGRIELKNFVFNGMTKLDSGIVFWIVAEIGTSRPDEGED